MDNPSPSFIIISPQLPPPPQQKRVATLHAPPFGNTRSLPFSDPFMDPEDDRSRYTSSDRLTKRDDDGPGRKRRQSLSARSDTYTAELVGRRRSSTSMPNGAGNHSRRHSPLAEQPPSSVPPTIEENPANANNIAIPLYPESMTVDSQHTSQGATPYGTRSRNRTGGPRPNYAEDHDFDLDVEPNGIIAKTGGSKRSPVTLAERSPAAESERATGMSTRRGFAAVNGTATVNGNSSSVLKDLIPGTSTFSANPTIPPNGSKKRKQPGGQIALNTLPQHTQQSFGKTRGSSRGHHETSMMSFDMSQGNLQNGQLIADDGTSLQVNGKSVCIHGIHN